MECAKIKKTRDKCRKGFKPENPISRCSTQKVYICVFCCQSSRAVHLELLNDKTTEEFLLAIKRMANRRSMPLILHSHKAVELIKGKNQIKALYEKLNNAKTH